MLIKSQLIVKIAQDVASLPEANVAQAINSIIEQLSSALSTGDRIEIRGFGSFDLHFRPPRKAHNPKTGKQLTTKEKYAAHFKPGKELRERVNKTREKFPLSKDNT